MQMQRDDLCADADGEWGDFSMKKERIFYYDLLKSIAMILVCCYHFSMAGTVGYTEPLAWSLVFRRALFGISSIGVPIFFMVNGAILLNKNLNLEKHTKGMLKLLVQFYIWKLIMMLVFIYAWNLDGISKSQFVNGWLFFQPIEGLDFSALWFMPMLFSVHLIFPFFKAFFEHMSKRQIQYIYLVMAFIFLVFFAVNDLDAFTSIWPRTAVIHIDSLRTICPFDPLWAVMAFYFLLGGLLQRYKDKIRIHPVLLIFTFLLGMGLLTVEWYLRSRVLQGNWDSVFNGYSTFAAALMAASLFLLCAKIKNERVHKPTKAIIGTIGNNTLTVYYLHWILGWMFRDQISLWIYTYVEAGLLLNTVKALVLVVFCACIGAIGRRIPIVKHLFT